MQTFHSTEFSGKEKLKKSLLLCGIFSSLFYVATDLLASMSYDGYIYSTMIWFGVLASGLLQSEKEKK